MSIKVGKKIKNIRKLKNLSIEELAERSNLDSEQLIDIEDKEVVPAVGPLLKIANGLNVRLGTFLDDTEHLGPVVTKSNQKIKGMSFSNGTNGTREQLDFYTLASEKTTRHMEPFMVEIEPLVNTKYVLSSHEGEEFLYVLEGEVEINYGKQIYNLKKGDSIYYDSVVSHNVHAGNNQKAKILAVIYTPS